MNTPPPYRDEILFLMQEFDEAVERKDTDTALILAQDLIRGLIYKVFQ
jgi:hypothetical protein